MPDAPKIVARHSRHGRAGAMIGLASSWLEEERAAARARTAEAAALAAGTAPALGGRRRRRRLARMAELLLGDGGLLAGGHLRGDLRHRRLELPPGGEAVLAVAFDHPP